MSTSFSHPPAGPPPQQPASLPEHHRVSTTVTEHKAQSSGAGCCRRSGSSGGGLSPSGGSLGRASLTALAVTLAGKWLRMNSSTLAPAGVSTTVTQHGPWASPMKRKRNALLLYSRARVFIKSPMNFSMRTQEEPIRGGGVGAVHTGVRAAWLWRGLPPSWDERREARIFQMLEDALGPLQGGSARWLSHSLLVSQFSHQGLRGSLFGVHHD